MNALNKGQAMVPEGCTVINNPVGSASVSWFEKEMESSLSMPGVPQGDDCRNDGIHIAQAA